MTPLAPSHGGSSSTATTVEPEHRHPVARDVRVLLVPRLAAFAVAAWAIGGTLPVDVHLVMLLVAASSGLVLMGLSLRAPHRRIRRLAFHAGMATDLAVLTLLIHLTGGLLSPLTPLPLVWVTVGMLVYRGRAAVTYIFGLAATISLQPVFDRVDHPHPPVGDQTTLAYVTVVLVVSTAVSLEVASRVIERRQHALTVQASRDPLTGVGNRRALAERLRQLVDLEVPYALALLDLDHFKRVNDEHGHGAGDLVLQRFAQRLEASLRDGDEVYRLGGEEFAVVLPEATAEQACRTLRRVQERLRDAPLVSGLPAVAFSGGISDHNSSNPMEAADRLLYAAKRSGRDRITCSADQASLV